MFTWKPIYSELASALPAWRSRQSELIAILHAAREQRVPVGALQDKDNKGKSFPLQVIDPFTFFASFNRKIRDEHRIKLLSLIKDKLGLAAPLPTDFEGLPLMNPQKSWFFSFQKDREPDAVDTLWDFAKAIVEQSPEAVDAKLFSRSMAIRQVGLANLTMGLFWMRPDQYLAVDKRNRALLNHHGVGVEVADWPSYLNLLQQAKKQLPGSSWSELSHRAYHEHTSEGNISGKRYWLFQANPDIFDTPRALKAGALHTWQVNKHKQHIKPGDQFVIWQSGKNSGAYAFATVTTPVGTLEENKDEAAFRLDGKPDGEPFTGVELRVDRNFSDTPILKEVVTKCEQLENAPIGRQGTNFALTEKQFRAFESLAPTRGQAVTQAPTSQPAPFTEDDALADLFMSPDELKAILARLKRKKALILQGPPGVGKTFIARRLAFALMRKQDTSRIKMIQFHPSYGYEDFVQGFRPTPTGLERRDGVFYKFAQLARNDPDRDWFFIIDEINRGNLAKIFGELLMLIEADKRGPDDAIPLTYSEKADENFYLPANLHFIGTMNTADRSLAMVDYALRRRFAFATLDPALGPRFATWLKGRNASDALIARICTKVGNLNAAIEKERDLGPGFRIGQSFFCPPVGQVPDDAWYREVIAGEIQPLLEEYFDSRERVRNLVDELLA